MAVCEVIKRFVTVLCEVIERFVTDEIVTDKVVTAGQGHTR